MWQKCLTTTCMQNFSAQSAMTLARPQMVSFSPLVENAKIFKEDILRRNVKNSKALNLQGLRLGVNAVLALSNSETRKSAKYDKVNLADNQISDYGMHAVKNLLHGIHSINLASNMISGDGLELILEDLIKNTTLKHLDLGVVEGSIRKNSLQIQGAICISALLIRNRCIESLSLNDNDLGSDGGECLGIALAQNESLKSLKVAENDLKSEGAIPIIKSAKKLEVLNLSKNFMKADVGRHLAKLIKVSTTLKKLYVEYNELMIEGAKFIAKGIQSNPKQLEVLNVKGNIIGDEGCLILADALSGNEKLRELDISLNEIGPNGFQAICDVLP